MKQFIGLLKMEHRHLGVTYLVLAALSLIALYIAPLGIVYYYPHLVVEHVRFTSLIPLAILNYLAGIVLFRSSLKRDIKVKDIWLHSASTMYMLVGVKMVYQLIGLIIVEACVFSGFFFIGDLVEGTILEFIVFALFSTVLTIFFYVFLIVFVYFFIVLNLQGKRYIGKFSIILMLGALLVYFKILEWLPTETPLQVGKVDFSWLENYMPNFGNDVDVTVVFSSLYIVEELFMWAVLIAIFMGTSKWLERVLMR
ncbi:MAG: hypothetical protein ABS942_05860 [Solibacillus sp.]|uniref:hypothetical protein n=1 Tax=Solibacillus sp. TaxID=1909654 RepID=UPI0033163B05